MINSKELLFIMLLFKILIITIITVYNILTFPEIPHTNQL